MSTEALLGLLGLRSSKPPSSPRFVYVDFSNIALSYLHRYRLGFPEVSGVVGLLEGGDPTVVKARFAAGSTPRKSSKVWRAFEALGYDVAVQDSAGREQFVDHVLHGRILRDLLKHEQEQRGRGGSGAAATLVLATGDGNDNGGGNNTSFPEVVRSALHQGWSVEIWSFRHALSGVYLKMQRELGGRRMAVCYFDDHLDVIRRRKEGEQTRLASPAGHSRFCAAAARLFFLALFAFIGSLLLREVLREVLYGAQ
jgi:hypothetical protein